MKFICSLIVVEDVKKSRFLYETILKQKVVTDFGKNVAFENGFAIHEKNHFRKLIDNKQVLSKAHNFELYFEDDDLEKIEHELKNSNFEFIHEIREQPWKQKVLRFYDYDKNVIEIGERLEHVAYRLFLEKYSLEEISKITYFPIDKVTAAIEEYDKKSP